eukprot:m.108000 g.108000  ORF g.108000 m.108000 type:complete len:76 (-) comp15202_c1_seq1:313-540(-)
MHDGSDARRLGVTCKRLFAGKKKKEKKKESFNATSFNKKACAGDQHKSKTKVIERRRQKIWEEKDTQSQQGTPRK